MVSLPFEFGWELKHCTWDIEPGCYQQGLHKRWWWLALKIGRLQQPLSPSYHQSTKSKYPWNVQVRQMTGYFRRASVSFREGTYQTLDKKRRSHLATTRNRVNRHCPTTETDSAERRYVIPISRPPQLEKMPPYWNKWPWRWWSLTTVKKPSETRESIPICVGFSVG